MPTVSQFLDLTFVTKACSNVGGGAGWLVVRTDLQNMVGWVVGGIGWPLGYLAVWLVGLLLGCLVGGWLVGWLVCKHAW